MTDIDITGLDKAEVLVALYEEARPVGLSILAFTSGPMPLDVARELIEGCNRNGYFYFDYLNGRSLKVSLRGDTFDPRLYDRDNGEGAASAVIERLRKGKPA